MVLYAVPLILIMVTPAPAAEVGSPQGEIAVVEMLVREQHLRIGIEAATAVFGDDQVVLPARLGLPSTHRPPRVVQVSVEATPSAVQTARSLAAAVERADGPFRYRVEETSVGPVLVPTQRRDASGAWSPVTVLLDTSVSVPPGEATVGDLVQGIVNELVAGGVRVAVPTGIPYASEVVRGSGQTVPARQALADIYRQTANDIVWSHRIGISGDAHALNFLRAAPPVAPDEWDEGWESPAEIRQLIEDSKSDTPWQ